MKSMIDYIGLFSAFPQRFRISRDSFYQPNGLATNNGLIFFPHVNGDFGVSKGFKLIREQTGAEVGFYSGKPPFGVAPKSWDDIKI